ncbi:Methionine aminopeptidase 1 [Elasticomyces elasticus]|nr:Methionine aminopeptidase 1 [Elasticomyces elasticus]
MTVEAPSKKQCQGADCENVASALQCPTCQKIGKESFFCSQDCFKRNWSTHKVLHQNQSNPLRTLFPPKVISEPDPATGHYNPFPTFPYTGSLRPVYPLSSRREVPKRITHPDYANDGIPRSEQKFVGRNNIRILDKKEQDGMRKVCRLAREVLDIAAQEVKPGVTTDYIDKVVHKACLERDSVCTSPNEVICHGIPDQRTLVEGDIVNIDVTLYHGGFHGDLNETYYVGESASKHAASVRVVETARQCLDQAIKAVKPGTPFRDYGNIIEKHAKSRDCSVIKTYCGHGINQLFHCAPNVPHYAKNKAVGTAKPGMCFTIEPMISLGSYKDKTWPDNWTSVTSDGSRTAQFEHTLLVTEDGVEVLTARLSDSPGGPMPMPVEANGEKPADTNGDKAADVATA